MRTPIWAARLLIRLVGGVWAASVGAARVGAGRDWGGLLLSGISLVQSTGLPIVHVVPGIATKPLACAGKGEKWPEFAARIEAHRPRNYSGCLPGGCVLACHESNRTVRSDWFSNRQGVTVAGKHGPERMVRRPAKALVDGASKVVPPRFALTVHGDSPRCRPACC